jgi:hypothetical protein
LDNSSIIKKRNCSHSDFNCHGDYLICYCLLYQVDLWTCSAINYWRIAKS